MVVITFLSMFICDVSKQICIHYIEGLFFWIYGHFSI